MRDGVLRVAQRQLGAAGEDHDGDDDDRRHGEEANEHPRHDLDLRRAAEAEGAAQRLEQQRAERPAAAEPRAVVVAEADVVDDAVVGASA